MNYLIVLGLIIIAIGGLLGSYLIHLGNLKNTDKDKEELKSHVSNNLSIEAINVESQKNKPRVNVLTKVSTSTQNEKNGYIDILIEVNNLPAESIAIDYPLQGIVKDFQDLNSTTDAESSTKVVQGGDQGEAVNNINLFVKNITPDRKLTYRIFYQPTLQGVFIGSRDRYEVTLNWQYKGNNYSETQWRMIENDELTSKPPFLVKGVKIYNKVLTPGEIKSSFEEGIKNRKFE